MLLTISSTYWIFILSPTYLLIFVLKSENYFLSILVLKTSSIILLNVSISENMYSILVSLSLSTLY